MSTTNNHNNNANMFHRVDLESVPSFFVEEEPSAAPSLVEPTVASSLDGLWNTDRVDYESLMEQPFSAPSYNPAHTFARNSFPPYTLPPSSCAPSMIMSPELTFTLVMVWIASFTLHMLQTAKQKIYGLSLW